METPRKASVSFGGSRIGAASWRRVLLVATVLAIFSLAIGLRFYGLNWDNGFPYTPHPDERAILMKVGDISPPGLGEIDVLFDADESPWNPRWFPYGSFPLYALKAVQLLSGLGPGDELTDLRLAGRIISAVADVATVAVVFVLGSRVYGRRVGILASAFVAVAVLHIQLSHFFAVDTLLALFTTASLYFMYRVAREGRPRDSALAGACIGLGLATKISLAPILGAFVVAHLMYVLSIGETAQPALPAVGVRWSTALKSLAAGAAVSLAVFFVTQPYTFLDWSRFYEDAIEQSEMVRRVRDYPYTRQYIDTTPYWYQVRQLATWGLGWPMGIVAWAGLLYASVRGLRFRYALAYMGLGWALPIGILLFSTSFVSIFAAAAVSLAALIGTLPSRRADSRADVLLLSWVVPYFLIIGAFEVKFLRYLIPITPVLMLFGARMLFAAWDRLANRTSRPALRPWLVVGVAVLLGSSGFYALAYTSVYAEDHTAVRASEWINQNAPKGSVILKEHWEEGLPNLNGYRVRELPLYEADTSRKVDQLALDLAAGDYLVFFSNRLYGTIPRLPERYPVSAEYYRLLFSGELGFELVRFEATYPELLGVSFVDGTFRRPGVPEPSPLQEFMPSRVVLNLGHADESFTVYDHPKVLVFQNVGRNDAKTMRRIMEGAAPLDSAIRHELNGRSIGLMMSPEDAEAQQSGGTWSGIVRADSWTNRFPVVAWLILVEGIALLALPITFLVFRPLSDRGYLFSKALGLLLVCLVVWMLASLHWMAFSRASISVALLGLTLTSVVILARRRREFITFVRERWSILLIGEVIFLAAFLSFVLIRMANPDLWHPWRGGEKPMEFAYLNAVLRSTYMPPYDPWFGGGYMNYYYWGQFIVATLIRATGIDPAVAFNLAVPMFFALTVAGSFTIVYNLAEGTRRRLQTSRPVSLPPLTTWQGDFEPDSARPESDPDIGSRRETRLRWSPVLAGVGGALFVTVIGNLDMAIQVGHGAWRAWFRNAPFGELNFYFSSRMMPTELQGITEFPFFTFVFGDLHAHMMAMPFALLALGLALAVVVGVARHPRWRGFWTAGEMARLAMLGLVVGSLRLLNAWDFPTYLIIAVVAIFLAEYFFHGGLFLAGIAKSALKAIFVFAVGYLAFLPFHLNYVRFFNSLESTTDTTILWRFLGISGLFIFIIGSFFIAEFWDTLSMVGHSLKRRILVFVNAVGNDDERSTGERGAWGDALWGIASVLGTLLLAYLVTAILSGIVGSTIPFAVVLLVLVLAAGLRWLVRWRVDSPHIAFVAVIVSVSLALVIGSDIFRMEGDVDRMNSIFKFYLQIWVLMALASAYLLWRLAHGRRVQLAKLAWGKKAWLGALAVLIVSASVFTVVGTHHRLGVRFNPGAIGLTLDGTAYVQGTVYLDDHGEIDLAADFEGIRWLRENIQGSPIVLEGHTPTYKWGGRISVYTGLPSVVGWEWHQEQQRWGYRWAIDDRISDVNSIYRTNDAAEALSLMRKYGVKYVYVGQLERLYYPGEGLDKFDGALRDDLERVFSSDQVAVYRVLDGASLD